ncbi:sugar porter family MFS transporter [Mycetocola spongiae]|uniref:sugar porter family MFS transporter n=1 Tax=Mycetocola spongiae TaxID=2859226 RepID=UPI001CF0F96E|nr:sugar porter family MFS transporter [Mycetocola spongiae]
MSEHVTAADRAAQKKLQRRVIGVAASAAVGGFLFGFDSSVVNGAVDAMQQHFALSDGLIGFAVASALLGCAAGAYIAGGLADRRGRIFTMLLGAALFLASSFGAAFAFAPWDLILWRVIGGLGIGIASVVAPAYIAEIAPKYERGRLASLQQLAITLGIFAALLSDASLATGAGGASEPFWFGLDAWRWMFLVCAIPALIYGVLALRLPESPRYLLMHGREPEARAIFETLWPAKDIESAVTEANEAIELDRTSKKASLFRGRRLLPIVWIGIILSMFQQFVGINVIFYYSTTLWKAVGFGEDNSLLIGVITSVINVVATLVAISLVDRIGRRPILLTGSIGMTLALGTMALAFANATTINGEVHLEGPWGMIALIAANLFVVCFAASWGPLVWVLLGEIFPGRIRGKALGVAAMAQWIANFLITVSFPAMAAASLPLTYGMYALFAFGSLLFVWFKIPETNGLSLEQAETLFTRKGAARTAGGAGA